MDFAIHIKCPECEGYGILYQEIAADDFKERECHECDGSGSAMHVEAYDSLEDAKADYPKSEIFPVAASCQDAWEKWNRAKAIQRGEMIANLILGPTLGSGS
jgi:excinuclease UvrABC ATPase subunit